MKKLIGLMTLLVAALILTTCGGATAPSAPAETVTPAAKVVTQPATWEQQWNKVVAEAKKEGKLTIYAQWRSEVRTAILPALRTKYGIDVEFLPYGRGAELQARLEAEKRAGLAVADVLGAGATTFVAGLKPAGLLGPIEPLLILPEVRNPQLWQGGQFPWMDKDHRVVNLTFKVVHWFVRNKDMVKEGEVTTYRDVLKPQFKGKITLSDPTVSGGGNGLLTHLAVDLWTPEEAYEFLRQLVKQNAMIERDSRMHVESLVRGKYAIALGTQSDVLVGFLEMGAPIAPITVKEGIRAAASVYSMAVPTVSASPNATTVFVNWILSKEGQTILSRGSLFPSVRLDVSTEGMDPNYLPVPGVKLYPDSEEWQLTAGKMLDMSKKIIAEAK